MKIQAAVFREAARAELETLTLDDPRSDEVLVQVVASGVCHTDLKVLESGLTPGPVVLGHEGSGVVAAVGDAVRGLAVGDRVVMSFASCGACACCQAGWQSYCHASARLNFAGRRADGTAALANPRGAVGSHFFGQSSFATYALCNERNVVKVTDRVPLDLLGPLGCGIQTGAGAVLNSLRAKSGRSIAIFGTGAVGLSAVMAARVAGLERIVAVDRNPARLRLASELGATDVIDAADADVAAAIHSLTRGGADYVLDTTGVPAVIEHALQALAPLGAAGLVASPARGERVRLDVLNLMRGGRTVRGIIEGDSQPQTFIPELIELYLAGTFPFDRLVRYYAFSGINQALADLASGAVIKPVLRMASEAR